MKKNTKKILLWILDLAINAAIIVGLVLIIQTWIIAPFDVSGASMCDTLNFIDEKCESGYGEKIIINEATYLFGDPERGDIVVFKAPNNGDKYFIKRIIGIPGDTLEIRDGYVYITPKGAQESIKLEEEYLNETNRGNTKLYFSEFSVFEIPDDHYFVMGDNRGSSSDSRTCFGSSISVDCKQDPKNALINKEIIRGKAWLVWWPLSNIRTIDNPEYPELEALQ